MKKILAFVQADPLIAIQLVISSVLLILSLFVIGPLYQPLTSTVYANITYGERVFSGLLFLVGPVMTLTGVAKTNKGYANLAAGALTMAVTLFYIGILRVLVVGLAPITWVYPVSLGCILVVCYLRLKILKVENAGA